MSHLRSKLHNHIEMLDKVLVIGGSSFCFGRPPTIRQLPESKNTISEGLTFDELAKLLDQPTNQEGE